MPSKRFIAAIRRTARARRGASARVRCDAAATSLDGAAAPAHCGAAAPAHQCAAAPARRCGAAQAPLALVAVWTIAGALAGAAPPALAAAGLPPEVGAALDRAQVPRDAFVAIVQDVGARTPRLAWQADLPVNPASLTKLVTTFAGLELLGPAWTWTTPVWLQGSVQGGVLDGNLVIKGSGDPKLVVEKLWLLLRRVQQLGVHEIRGDIVLDRSAFAVPEQSAAEFDGEPLRPYNVRADALQINYKAVVLTFTPDLARGVARVASEPPLEGVRVDTSVALVAAPCDDWRAALKAEFSDPARIRFKGPLAIACGEKTWPVAYADPNGYNARALAGLWREMGGMLSGSVHDGAAPVTPPTFDVASPALAEVVRDINKFSNNVMAQQLFLTLGATQRGNGSADAARAVLHDWLAARVGAAAADAAMIDNGSGLSRATRLSATLFAQLLEAAWESPVMPELMGSLPISGIDGTLKQARGSLGRAHLKTGSLRDVNGIAGYVLADSGRRRIVVGIVNHPNAAAARPALDALVRWAAKESIP